MRQTQRHHYCVIKHPYGVNVELLQIPCSLSAVHSGKDSQEQIHPPAAYVLFPPCHARLAADGTN